MKLIVGLGNPGAEYHLTRHNVGFFVLDAYATYNSLSFTKAKFNGVYILANEIILAKPQTYMNLSGDFVSALMRFYKIGVEDVLVIYDDLHLALGAALLKPQGSAAGQKGMHDIITKLGTSNIARLRIGIGAPVHDATSHVLSKLSANELTQIGALLPQLFQAINLFCAGDLAAAMKLINTAAPSSTSLL